MFCPVFQHVINRGQHRVGDGADGRLRTALGFQSMELGFVVAVLLFTVAWPTRRIGPARSSAKEALSEDARTFALAGALVLAGTQARPGDEMAGRGEAAHVPADFREDDRYRAQ